MFKTKSKHNYQKASYHKDKKAKRQQTCLSTSNFVRHMTDKHENVSVSSNRHRN